MVRLSDVEGTCKLLLLDRDAKEIARASASPGDLDLVALFPTLRDAVRAHRIQAVVNGTPEGAPLVVIPLLNRETIRTASDLRPDGKTQVTIEYDGHKAVALDPVVISSQHAEEVDVVKQLTPEIISQVIDPVLAKIDLPRKDMRTLINPTGRFVIGGPMGDAGLTGRKIIVDTYGGMARHGGGAFSGKDPSKVDRSAAYAARWVAKHVVASGAAEKCEVQVAYAIGMSQPISILVETFGTNTVSEESIEKAVRDVFDLRPGAIVRDLDLKRPIYAKTAAYGHFGRPEPEFTWEALSRLSDFKAAVKL